MVDSGWDNSGLPVQKKGMPTWAKVLLGCGVVVLLLMATCVGGCVWVARNPDSIAQWGSGKLRDMAQKPWADMQQVVAQLGTDEGARALYAANPDLSKRFATEEDFLRAVREWRPKLADVPKEMPDPMDLVKRGDFNLRYTRDRQDKGVDFSFRTPGGTRITLEWRKGKLTDLEVS